MGVLTSAVDEHCTSNGGGTGIGETGEERLLVCFETADRVLQAKKKRRLAKKGNGNG